MLSLWYVEAPGHRNNDSLLMMSAGRTARSRIRNCTNFFHPSNSVEECDLADLRGP
jgi:hypothetical protein